LDQVEEDATHWSRTSMAKAATGLGGELVGVKLAALAGVV
jgi:hypothetical protein